MSSTVNTSGKAWIVTRHFHNRGERFADKDEAMRYAELLAKRIHGEHVEVFECTANLRVDLPVATLTKEEPAEGATARKDGL